MRIDKNDGYVLKKGDDAEIFLMMVEKIKHEIPDDNKTRNKYHEDFQSDELYAAFRVIIYLHYNIFLD